MIITAKEENAFTGRRNVSRHRFSFKRDYDNDEFSSLITTVSERNFPSKRTQTLINASKKNNSNSLQKSLMKRYDEDTLDHFSYKPSLSVDTVWIKTPYQNFTARKDSFKKHAESISWPTWSSKKEIFHNNRNKKNRKYLDSLEDYLALDSKYHEMADRKYIHEHEGFFFPIHVPSSHHDKDDNLIPLLLLLLLPLLLFAIIIPLNANLLSTLFLIMQNNGATATAAQLAAASGRRKRHLLQVSHPIVEQRIMEVLHKISALTEM